MRGNADGGLRALFLYFERKKESERSAEGGGGGGTDRTLSALPAPPSALQRGAVSREP